jgi:hypothetical protein
MRMDGAIGLASETRGDGADARATGRRDGT